DGKRAKDELRTTNSGLCERTWESNASTLSQSSHKKSAWVGWPLSDAISTSGWCLYLHREIAAAEKPPLSDCKREKDGRLTPHSVLCERTWASNVSTLSQSAHKKSTWLCCP